MIIQCENCQAKFKLDDSRVTEKGVKVKCAKCKDIFVVKKEAPADVPADVPPSPLEEKAPDIGGAPPADKEPEVQAEPAGKIIFDASEGSLGLEGEKEEEDTTSFDVDEDADEALAAFDVPEDADEALASSDVTEEEEESFDAESFDIGGDEDAESFDMGEDKDAESFDMGGDKDAESFDIGEDKDAESFDIGGDEDAESFDMGGEEDTPSFDMGGEEDTPSFDMGGEEDTPSFDIGGEEDAPSFEMGGEEDAPSFDVGGEEEPQEAEGESDVDFGEFALDGDDAPEEEEAPGEEMSLELEEKEPEDEGEEPPKEEFSEAQERREIAEPDKVEKTSASGKGNKLVVMALLLIIIAGGGVYFLPQIKPILKPIIEMAKEKMGVEEEGTISIKSLNGYYLQTDKEGPLFIIEAEAQNDYKAARSFIQVKGNLYDDKGKVVMAQIAYAGNSFSGNMLLEMSKEEVRKEMSYKVGKGLSNSNIMPGSKVDFMLVFYDAPKSLAEFDAEVVSSEDATQ